MAKSTSNLLWFVEQLRKAELILSNAIDESEKFEDKDKQIINSIINDVKYADLTLLQLLDSAK